ncbi:MAG: hypothetical protein P8I03_13090 [Thalassotalea sp.]|nr:hypothetical protein [Thalassotalea sp.]
MEISLFQATAELLKTTRGGEKVSKRDKENAAKFIERNNKKRKEAGLSEVY